MAFDRVVVIFNPSSTGDAAAQAQRLEEDLRARVPTLPVELQATRYAGHARELAREAAAAARPLIVSVSGDGGYNEVVNGAVEAGNDAATCAVLAAGNANDHRRATRHRPLTDAIIEGAVSRLDLLRLTVAAPDPLVRYAHSYIGLGLTPVVAVDLEKGTKGSLREMLTVVRAFARFRPFEIRLADGSPLRFDSIVFANIREMAKVARLSDRGEPDDGRFEVITIRHTAKWRVAGTAMKAITRGLGPQPSVREYAFTPLTPMPIQADGEVIDLPAGTSVRVDIAPRALRTVR